MLTAFLVSMKNQKIEKRPIDVYLDKYTEFHTKPVNRIINYICIPLILFSIIGFAWSIPFPHLGFLGVYNGYLNWASFLIAFLVYFYYKLSPLLSYLVLLILFGFSFVIIQLEQWEKTGGFVLPQICLIIFVLANSAQLIGYKIEGKKPTIFYDFQFLFTGPIWLLSLILKKFKIRY
ncbi:MAG: hypothetical protein JWR67_732 [Mucilaginibacter sp.]|nr:hypothetical protein [Mucilaginibacter sp.]